MFANGDSCGLVLPLSLGLTAGATGAGVATLGAFFSLSLRHGCVTRTRLTSGVCGTRVAVSYDAKLGALWVLHCRRGGLGAPMGNKGASPNTLAPSPSPSPITSPFGSADRGVSSSPALASAGGRVNGVGRVMLVKGQGAKDPWWIRQAVTREQQQQQPGAGVSAAVATVPAAACSAAPCAGTLIPDRSFCMVCAYLGVGASQHCAVSPLSRREPPVATPGRVQPQSFVSAVFSFGAAKAPAAAAPAPSLEVRVGCFTLWGWLCCPDPPLSLPPPPPSKERKLQPWCCTLRILLLSVPSGAPICCQLPAPAALWAVQL